MLFLWDTGAELDAIPRETFRRGFESVKLVPAASPETATESPIVNDGTFSATLNWNADDDETAHHYNSSRSARSEASRVLQIVSKETGYVA